jgi:hypothetical protein
MLEVSNGGTDFDELWLERLPTGSYPKPVFLVSYKW